MFESIQDSLSTALRSLRGTAKFTEANMQEGMRGVRRALLQADVNVDVANTFIQRVEQAAVGREILKTVNPSQMIVQVVYEELVKLMGPVDPSIKLAKGRPTVLMMCGLQGSGKTTTVGKLGRLLKRQGQHPMLVAADLQRPAAIEQLRVLGQQLDIPVHYEDPQSSSPVTVCQNAVKAAKRQECNIVLLDTAGRLHIDDELMHELKTIDRRVGPDQCLLVVDALTGQDAVRSAQAFNDALELDACILTKLDGDSRGGAALSIKEVTGVPIKYAGTGEKLEELEPFDAEGMASRILGMGDVLGLVRKAQETITQEEAEKQQKKMEQGKFDLEDFRDQLQRLSGMGSMRKMLEMLPGGFSQMMPEDVDPEKEVGRVRAMVDSMTKEERRNPDVIDHSRRRRIARGSGVEPHEINKLIKQFGEMRKMMQSMATMSVGQRMRQLVSMQRQGAFTDGGPMVGKERSKRGQLSGRDLAAKRKQERQRKKQNRKRR